MHVHVLSRCVTGYLVQGAHFPGLIPLIFVYLDVIECDEETKSTVSGYMDLIVKRATGMRRTAERLLLGCVLSVCVDCNEPMICRSVLVGTLPTFAQWMRAEVMAHPAYKHDSNVTQEIAFDVLSVRHRVASQHDLPPHDMNSCAHCTTNGLSLLLPN
jgi:glutamate--cysteine ligase catalytic subunit